MPSSPAWMSALALSAWSEPIQDLTSPRAPQEINGGRTTAPGEYESTVALRPHQQICSGVLVSPTIVLTAAHCVADIGFGQQITMYYGTTAEDDRRHQAAEWAAHPRYCPDCREDWYDIGYVVLTLPYEPSDGDGDYAVPVVTQREWDVLMREGNTLEVVGYGSGSSEPRTKRVAEVELTGRTPSGRELHASPLDGRTCGGDSGGPYFARGEDGEMRLVGIHSRSDDCGGTMIATPPYPMLCWLREETGLDLLDSSTADCSEIDTSHGGCRVDPRGNGVLVLVVSLIAMRRRRRARTERAARVAHFARV